MQRYAIQRHIWRILRKIMSRNRIDVVFGNELRKLRKGRKLSQSEFAEICDIDMTYYGRMERGEHSVTISTCSKIANGLGIHLSALFTNMPDIEQE
jgi:transcriptional regulator with XRE-family HTH domain